MRHIEEFTSAFIEALYFIDTGEDGQPENDANLAPETREQIVKDCRAFLWLYGALIDDENITKAGHDFYFTRCGHGVGFWDRPKIYGDQIATTLTEAVGWRTIFPPLDLYQGDDGMIYI